MQIQDTLANVTAIMYQVENKIAKLKYSNSQESNLWREFLNECKDFVRAETERLKILDTTIGENIAQLLEHNYEFGFNMLVSNKEMITEFFNYIAKSNIEKTSHIVWNSGVSLYIHSGNNPYSGTVSTGSIIGLYFTDLIKESDWSKVYKKAASKLGVTKSYRVSSRSIYRGASVSFTQKGESYTDYNTLFGYACACHNTRVSNQGYDKYYMTSHDVCAN